MTLDLIAAAIDPPLWARIQRMPWGSLERVRLRVGLYVRAIAVLRVVENGE